MKKPPNPYILYVLIRLIVKELYTQGLKFFNFNDDSSVIDIDECDVDISGSSVISGGGISMSIYESGGFLSKRTYKKTFPTEQRKFFVFKVYKSFAFPPADFPQEIQPFLNPNSDTTPA